MFDHNDNLLLLLSIKYAMELQTSEQQLKHVEETYRGECPFLQSFRTITAHELSKISLRQQGLQNQDHAFEKWVVNPEKD